MQSIIINQAPINNEVTNMNGSEKGTCYSKFYQGIIFFVAVENSVVDFTQHRSGRDRSRQNAPIEC